MARNRLLTVTTVLTWADLHHARTGRWPTPDSGPAREAPGETWGNINRSLYEGYRGLPGGSSLDRLLQQRRGKGRLRRPLTEAQVLAWADHHRERTGRWPHLRSGPVAGAPGEVWGNIDRALRHGRRGLPGDSSLSWLLAQHGREG